MNERIKELIKQASYRIIETDGAPVISAEFDKEKFAELIVEECRNVVSDVYRNTPLELCGPLLAADEEIAKHFYGIKE